jgi:hypothetical protein
MSGIANNNYNESGAPSSGKKNGIDVLNMEIVGSSKTFIPV